MKSFVRVCLLMLISMVALASPPGGFAADLTPHSRPLFDPCFDEFGPAGIAVGPDSNVYVVDSVNNRIQVFDSSGNFLKSWGSEGSGNGQFCGPIGIAVNSDGQVYVADTANQRIQWFDKNGNYLGQWGTQGTGPGQFQYPAGVGVDFDGNVYVADFGNYRFQKFDPQGKYLSQVASIPPYPSGITTDAKNNVYVTTINASTVMVFDDNGNNVRTWGSQGSGNGQFQGPLGIAIDPSTNFGVYVVDCENNRIQVFDMQGNY